MLRSIEAMPTVASRRRLARLHAGLVVAIVLCTTAFTFEVLRALGGNTLSWAYVFEWPILLGYGVYMWWRLVREERHGTAATTSVVAMGGGDDAALEAWNRYLAELHAADAAAATGRQPRGRPSATDDGPPGRTSDGSTAARTPFTNLGDASVE
jgi:aminoglycoside phosphotransferase (APT) family kinase protein